jgi:hypothetical protein
MHQNMRGLEHGQHHQHGPALQREQERPRRHR